MYKIYINETPLTLREAKDLSELPKSDDHNLVARYPGKPKMLLSYADMLEKSSRFKSVTLYSENYKKLVEDFESNYNLVQAAGGVVFRENGEALFIFRRGYWDLPKGKIEKKEKRKDAAIREVQEETGLQQINLKDFLGTTHHTYRLPNGKRVLKSTYWYTMETQETELHPQKEEDIEKAVWMPLSAVEGLQEPIYKNILEVLAWAAK